MVVLHHTLPTGHTAGETVCNSANFALQYNAEGQQSPMKTTGTLCGTAMDPTILDVIGYPLKCILLQLFSTKVLLDPWVSPGGC